MDQYYYDENYKETNRDKRLSPRKTFFWCGCDRLLIRTWKKCPICHRRNGRKRFK